MAPVGQARERPPEERAGQPPQAGGRQVPDEGRQERGAVHRALPVEHRRPRSTRLLLSPGLGVQKRTTLPLVAAPEGEKSPQEPLPRPPGLLPWGHPDDVLHQGGGKQGLGPRAGIGRSLPENQDTGMVVDAEGLLCGRQVDGMGRRPVLVRRLRDGKGFLRIGELERTESRVGGEIRHQIKPQRAAEERPIIGDRQRIAGGEPDDRGVEPVGADDDVIGLIQPVEQVRPFLGRIFVVELQRPVGTGGEAPVHPAERVLPIHPQWGRPVPVLRRQDGSGRDVLENPAGSSDTGVRSPIDGGEGQGPQGGCQEQDRQEQGADRRPECPSPRAALRLTPGTEADQNPGRQQDEGRIDGEEIADGLDPLGTLVQEIACGPEPREENRVRKKSPPPLRTPAAEEADACDPPARPCRQPQRKPHHPQKTMLTHGKTSGSRLVPLMAGVCVHRAGHQAADFGHILEPPGVQAEAEESRSQKGVGLSQAEGQERTHQGQEAQQHDGARGPPDVAVGASPGMEENRQGHQQAQRPDADLACDPQTDRQAAQKGQRHTPPQGLSLRQGQGQIERRSDEEVGETIYRVEVGLLNRENREGIEKGGQRRQSGGVLSGGQHPRGQEDEKDAPGVKRAQPGVAPDAGSPSR